nr:hypothetical protein GCM10020093_108620 [Planobispora longispora]
MKRKRMRRLYVPLSALALAAGALTATTGPAAADHCDPAEQGQDSQQNQDNRSGRNGQQDQDGQQGQNDQRQQQDQDGRQGQSGRQNQQGSQNQQSPEDPQDPQDGQDGQDGQAEDCADLGPFPQDFVDIRQTQPNVQTPRTRRGGSAGSFVSRCGRNQNGHRNSDNFIVAPGVTNGAHHVHDYVGNLSTDAFSTDASLAAAGTTCAFGDRSTYFWPVLRDRTVDANTQDPDGNVGRILTPAWRSCSSGEPGGQGHRDAAVPQADHR